MAVKHVTSNKGKDTPGVDGVIWKDARARMQAVHDLKQHGYTLRRESGRKARDLSDPNKERKSSRLLTNSGLIDNAAMFFYFTDFCENHQALLPCLNALKNTRACNVPEKRTRYSKTGIPHNRTIQ